MQRDSQLNIQFINQSNQSLISDFSKYRVRKRDTLSLEIFQIVSTFIFL